MRLSDAVEDKRALGPVADAISALVNLGYGQPQAMAAISAAVRDAGDADTARLIRLGLKELATDEVSAMRVSRPKWLEHTVKQIHLSYSWLPAHEKTEVQLYFLCNMLEDRFKEYHLAKLNHPVAITDTAELRGVEFETYIARILTKCRYDASGTPATGDQGADLIAERDGRRIIIQAKRYEGAVANKAVQEVVGALSFYGGDQWVG